MIVTPKGSQPGHGARKRTLNAGEDDPEGKPVLSCRHLDEEPKTAESHSI